MEAIKAAILSAFEDEIHICPSGRTVLQDLPEMLARMESACKESERLPRISSRPNRSKVRILLFTGFWPAPCL